MAEIQRIQDTPEIRNEGYDPMQTCVDEWEAGGRQELLGALRQMRAAAYAKAAYGPAGLEEFGKKVRSGKSKVYAYAACFESLHKWYRDGISERLERSPQTPWQLVASVRRGEALGDVPKSVDRNDEELLGVREMDSETKHIRGKAEVAKTIICPRCQGRGEILVDEEGPDPYVPDVPGVRDVRQALMPRERINL